jgi:hypothetical protein
MGGDRRGKVGIDMNGINSTETVGMAGTMKDWVTTLSAQLERAQDGAVTQWLVDGIIVDGGSTMIHGLPGNGKSLIAMDLALAAAEGRKWLGAYEIAPQPVLYVDEDGNNDRELNARLLTFGAKAENTRLYFLLHKGFKITCEGRRRDMIAWCQERGIRLVIFDSLTRLHDLAEGSADEMKQVNRAIKDYTLAGISVVILHHSSKRGRAARGSGEIESGYDAIYRVEKADAATFHIQNVKARSVGVNGVWSGCSVSVGQDEDGRLTLDGSQPLPGEEEVAVVDKAAAKRDKMREGVLRLLEENDELTETAMAERLGNSSRDKDAFKELLAEMVADESIEHEKRGKGNWYWLTESGDADDPEGDEDGTEA